jgi:hypothetical protein
MDLQQKQELDELKHIDIKHSDHLFNYWKEYSSLDHWQFWVCFALLVIPLVLLFIFIDKRKALLLGFFGYNVHVFFTYIDAVGANNNYWYYPYKVLPILASNFTLDASLVPICYMFVLQWTLNHSHNYYLYMILLSIFFAFIFKPLLVAFTLFELDRGANYFHLFLGYIVVGFVAKWVTNLFVYLEQKAKA